MDFCCGANDFSWLMKAKLEETGKKCSYKNYDLFQAKVNDLCTCYRRELLVVFLAYSLNCFFYFQNDFCFEKRDWLTVCKEELPPGRRLVR